MKNLWKTALAVAVLLTLCACSGKKYEELNAGEKKIVRAASGYSWRSAADEVTLNGDPVLITDEDGYGYEFIPVRIVIGGQERDDVLMSKNEVFVAYASEDIPYFEIAAGTVEYTGELLKKVQCATLWDGYTDYGDGLAGMRISESLRVVSVETFSRRELEDLLNVYLEP